MKMEYVQNGKWGSEQETVEKIEENKFGDGIEEDDGIRVGVQGPATVRKHQSDCVRRKQDFEHYADGKR